MISYDPRGMTWNQWNSLMSELFGGQHLRLVPEDNWRDLAASMKGVGHFSNSGMPDSSGFENWEDWAQHLVGILTIRKNT